MNRENELLIFGCTTEDLLDSKPSYISLQMYATCILSDAQEELAIGHTETARQFINRAKYILNQIKE